METMTNVLKRPVSTSQYLALIKERARRSLTRANLVEATVVVATLLILGYVGTILYWGFQARTIVGL